MTFPPIEIPFRLHATVVAPDWIDANGHMNAWQYNTAFRQPMQRFFAMMGLGLTFTDDAGRGIFLLDCRIQYIDEVMVGMPLVFETRLVDYSDKIIHYLTTMLAGEERYTAATCEALEIQVEHETRRPVAFSTDLMAYLRDMLRAHNELPLPASVGGVIGIRRKS